LAFGINIDIKFGNAGTGFKSGFNVSIRRYCKLESVVECCNQNWQLVV